MGKQRKYLDRGRKNALSGRPYEVDWLDLLGLGLRPARDGRANTAPFLSEVMWEDITSPFFPYPRPALLDHPFLRTALDLRESETMSYLAQQWSRAWVNPLPRNAAQVRELLGRPDCITAGDGAHRMTGYGAKMPEGTVTWYTGFCARCMRAMLLRIDDDAFSVRWWPFYDQEAAF